MKKIFQSLVSLFAVCSLVSCATVVFACSQDIKGGVITGGACSIKELQLKERQNTEQYQLKLVPFGARDVNSPMLRPVRPLSNHDECLLGMCHYRQMLRDAMSK